MSWTCTADVSADCLEGGMYDAPHRVDGQDVCDYCARELASADRTPFGVSD